MTPLMRVAMPPSTACHMNSWSSPPGGDDGHESEDRDGTVTS